MNTNNFEDIVKQLSSSETETILRIADVVTDTSNKRDVLERLKNYYDGEELKSLEFLIYIQDKFIQIALESLSEYINE